VDRGHVAGLDAEVVLQYLDHRDDAVGGTARVGDDAVLLRIVALVVDLVDEGGVHVLGGGRDDDLFGAAFYVRRGLLAVGEHAGGLDDYVGAHVAPGDGARIALGEGLYLTVPDAQDVAVELHVLVPDTVGGVTLEKERQALHRHQVVDRHDLDVVVAALYRRLGGQHPDATETVYTYSYGHSLTPVSRLLPLLSLCPIQRGD
jgi:hypothetical protein